MVRTRWAALTAAACLGLLPGCLSSWAEHSWFDRFRGIHEGPCCTPEGVCPEGPVLGECGPTCGPPAPVAPGVVPPLAVPPERLVPQPQPPGQATQTPYNPNNK